MARPDLARGEGAITIVNGTIALGDPTPDTLHRPARTALTIMEAYDALNCDGSPPQKDCEEFPLARSIADKVVWQQVSDWDSAYANTAHIPDGESYPGRWAAAAQSFRQREQATGRARIDLPYGKDARQRLDVFLPEGHPTGLIVFLHGGYWLAFDKGFWSHLAAGPLALGWAVAIPSYRLCPAVSLPEILEDATAAVAKAANHVSHGPIHLAGHSAGGHLVTRLVCQDSALPDGVSRRIGRVCSLSGVHDLRPLLNTEMAPKLRLDAEVAKNESPALQSPCPGTRLIAWVGAQERPEFRRQSALLANAWLGCGASTALVEAPGHHHFSVVEDLAETDSPLTHALCSLDARSTLY